ncbi:hypothetical protein [Diaphorobacter nitroreducens]
MNTLPNDHEKIARRAMEIMGGPDAFFNAADEELANINARWNQNVSEIGRILRAHLFVEHYLTQYLAQANPRLGSLSDARATFAQKVSLLDVDNPDIAAMLPGIKRLNAIRNRLAHNLGAQISDDDARIFLSCERFAALRAARSTGEREENEPLEVLEDFARHTAVSLTYEFAPLSKAIAQSILEVRNLGDAI